MNDLPAILGGEPIVPDRVPVSSATLPDFSVVEERYRDIFSTGMITNWKYVQEYEARMAKYLGVDHAVAVSSATTGLILLMKVLKLEGEVILPSFTFAVTGHVLAWNGLRPAYADIDPETCLIDPAEVGKAITPDTCAIMGVHIWGNPCAADELQRIADRHGLPLLFDAAQAVGSRYLERPVGGLGTSSVFSCSPTKLVTSGEGGIVATNDAELAEQVRIGRNYGDDGSYDCEFGGLNARLSEFHAALGLASLDMSEDNIAHRHHLIEMYERRLDPVAGIRSQKTTPGGVSNGVYFSVLVDAAEFGLTRDQLYEALKAENLDTRRYYHPPLHQQKVYAEASAQYAGKLPHTESVSSTALTLPMFSHMTEHQVSAVCDAIERLHEHRLAVGEEWAETMIGD